MEINDMGFMSEISEAVGSRDTYKSILTKMEQLESKYKEKYGVQIPEMYLEIFDDLYEYLKNSIEYYEKKLS